MNAQEILIEWYIATGLVVTLATWFQSSSDSCREDQPLQAILSVIEVFVWPVAVAIWVLARLTTRKK